MGVNADLTKLKAMGYDPVKYWVDNGNMDQENLIHQLKPTNFDGVLIGAGIRIPPSDFILMEKLINTVHENAPQSKIMFNTNPIDAAESIQRWM